MTTVDDSIEKRVATVGKELPFMETKIVDPETGEDLPNGQPGEFVVRGYNVMKGYYKRPELTAKVIDDEGWFNTGDLAVWTVNGEYSIVGRAKDTIVLSGGETVEPVPIEETIHDSPYVAASVVVGQDRKYLSALVVIDQGMVERYLKDSHIYYTNRDDLYRMPEVHSLIEGEIRERVSTKNGFRPFEQIMRCTLLAHAFEVNRELSAKQEVKRFVVNDMYRDLIEAMYEN